jgi:hypothetical protein
MAARDSKIAFDATLGTDNAIDFASRIEIGVHALLVYEDSRAARKAEFAFMQNGLENGQPAVYLSERDEAEDLLHDMQEFGINVEKYKAKKMLLVAKVRSPVEHPLGPSMGLDFLCQFILENVKPPLRMVGRLYRPISKELVQKNLQVEIEGQLNFKKLPWSAICSYDSALSHPELHDSWFLALLKNHDALITVPRNHKGIGFMMR